MKEIKMIEKSGRGDFVCVYEHIVRNMWILKFENENGESYCPACGYIYNSNDRHFCDIEVYTSDEVMKDVTMFCKDAIKKEACGEQEYRIYVDEIIVLEIGKDKSIIYHDLFDMFFELQLLK